MGIYRKSFETAFKISEEKSIVNSEGEKMFCLNSIKSTKCIGTLFKSWRFELHVHCEQKVVETLLNLISIWVSRIILASLLRSIRKNKSNSIRFEFQANNSILRIYILCFYKYFPRFFFLHCTLQSNNIFMLFQSFKFMNFEGKKVFKEMFQWKWMKNHRRF